jgi:hypothetical protein
MSVPSEPNKGQYLAAYGYVDFEGGGDLHFEMKECPECFAVIQAVNLDTHVGLHEAQSGSGPKKGGKDGN